MAFLSIDTVPFVCITSVQTRQLYNLGWELANNFFIASYGSLGTANHLVSATSTEVCHFNAKIVIVNM